LKQAYSYSNEIPLTKVDNFSIPPERTGRSYCPESFKPLSSFEWSADSTPFSQCPAARDTNFICSACFDSSGGGVFDKFVRIAFWMFIVIIVYFLKHGGKSSDAGDKWSEGGETSSEGSTNQSSSLLALTSMGKKYFYYQAIESDSSSEELEI